MFSSLVCDCYRGSTQLSTGSKYILQVTKTTNQGKCYLYLPLLEVLKQLSIFYCHFSQIYVNGFCKQCKQNRGFYNVTVTTEGDFIANKSVQSGGQVGDCASNSFSRTSQKVKKKNGLKKLEVKIEPHHRHSVCSIGKPPTRLVLSLFSNVLPF